jgi:hypothetical protein
LSELLRKLERAARRYRERAYGNFDCKTNIVALHEQRLLYFAVPKVANSSLKVVVTNAMNGHLPQDLQNAIDEGRNPFHGKHLRRRMYEEKRLLCKHQVRVYGRYVSFAIVRNPWDRLVSCYVQKIEQKDNSSGPNRKGTTGALDRAGAFDPDMSFAEFARAVAAIPDEEAGRHFRSQYTFLCDRRGNLLPERLGRFEHLAEDLSRVTDGVLSGNNLPHLKKTRRRDYRDYYDEETRDLVARRFARDIELFGYNYE